MATPTRGSKRPLRKPGAEINPHEFSLCLGGFLANSMSTIIHQKWNPNFVEIMQSLLININEAIKLLHTNRPLTCEKSYQASSSLNSAAASQISDDAQYSTRKRQRTSGSESDAETSTPTSERSRTIGSPIDAETFLGFIGGILSHLSRSRANATETRMLKDTFDLAISQLETLRCSVEKAIVEANHVPAPSNANLPAQPVPIQHSQQSDSNATLDPVIKLKELLNESLSIVNNLKI